MSRYLPVSPPFLGTLGLVEDRISTPSSQQEFLVETGRKRRGRREWLTEKPERRRGLDCLHRVRHLFAADEI